MALTADQERVKALLKDTITLLCKNGLEFKTEFSIDAVIGVTLDKNSLFYISMAETIHSDKPVIEDASAHSSEFPIESERRGRKRKKSLPDDSGEEDTGRSRVTSEDEQDNNSKSKQNFSSSPPKHQTKYEIKTENTEEEDEELVIIKEEPHGAWQEGDEYLDDMTFHNFGDPGPGSSSISQSDTGTSFMSQPGVSGVQSGNQSHNNSWSSARSDFHSPNQRRQGVPQASVSSPGAIIGDTSQQGVPSGSSEQRDDLYCSMCDRWFTSVGNLKRHMDAHYGKHQYKCEYCDRGFTSKDNLRGHIAGTHTGERQFGCDLCDSRFYSNGSLNSHRTRVHGIKPNKIFRVNPNNKHF